MRSRTRPDQATPFVDVIVEFVAEMLDETVDRHRRGIAESANGVALDVMREIHQLVEIVLAPASVLDAAYRAMQPAGAFAAGRALPAGFEW